MAKSLEKSSSFKAHLSRDIVFKILERLPLKSMLQMKSVCTLWRDIISDPFFIKKHLDRSNSLCLRRYIDTTPVTISVGSEDLERWYEHVMAHINAPRTKSVGLQEKETRYEYTIPVTNFSPNVEILGSCNGLLLLGDGDRTYYLWNPSTRLLRSFTGPYLFRGEIRNFALGYDSATSAYKAVRIVRVASDKRQLINTSGFHPPPYSDFCYDATTAQFYNCKTECWKKIKDFPYIISEDARGVSMNGYPHWVMIRDHFFQDNILELVIVYFDLVEEKFKEIVKPTWLVYSSPFEFGVYDGQLCFIHYTEPEIEKWVMQKHGESWINVSSVLDIANVVLPGWSSGHTHNDSSKLEPLVGAQYVESLVSPYGGNDMVG